MRFWTDSGPHYRSYECLGSMGMHVADRWEKNVWAYFGPPAHWKGECDGKFSHMNRATRMAAQEDSINNIPDLVHVFEEPQEVD